MVSPCLTKNVGSQLMKPYRQNPMTMFTRMPISVRLNTGGLKNTAILTAWVAITGVGAPLERGAP